MWTLTKRYFLSSERISGLWLAGRRRLPLGVSIVVHPALLPCYLQDGPSFYPSLARFGPLSGGVMADSWTISTEFENLLPSICFFWDPSLDIWYVRIWCGQNCDLRASMICDCKAFIQIQRRVPNSLACSSRSATGDYGFAPMALLRYHCSLSPSLDSRWFFASFILLPLVISLAGELGKHLPTPGPPPFIFATMETCKAKYILQRINIRWRLTMPVPVCGYEIVPSSSIRGPVSFCDSWTQTTS